MRGSIWIFVLTSLLEDSEVVAGCSCGGEAGGVEGRSCRGVTWGIGVGSCGGDEGAFIGDGGAEAI
nr:hypothetical protein [Tanacetum cinerariifolium]